MPSLFVERDRVKRIGGLALPIIGGMISQNIINRAPTAELAPDQLDADSLLPYSRLDPILESLYQDPSGKKAMETLEVTEVELRKIQGLLRKAEFKRQQAAPCLRISRASLTNDYRYPITLKGNRQ